MIRVDNKGCVPIQSIDCYTCTSAFDIPVVVLIIPTPVLHSGLFLPVLYNGAGWVVVGGTLCPGTFPIVAG